MTGSVAVRIATLAGLAASRPANQSAWNSAIPVNAQNARMGSSASRIRAIPAERCGREREQDDGAEQPGDPGKRDGADVDHDVHANDDEAGPDDGGEDEEHYVDRAFQLKPSGPPYRRLAVAS